MIFGKEIWIRVILGKGNVDFEVYFCCLVCIFCIFWMLISLDYKVKFFGFLLLCWVFVFCLGVCCGDRCRVGVWEGIFVFSFSDCVIGLGGGVWD